MLWMDVLRLGFCDGDYAGGSHFSFEALGVDELVFRGYEGWL